MTDQPVRVAAAELASRLALAAHDVGEGAVVAAVAGAAGSGRSGVLDAAAAVAERSGKSWRRIDELQRLSDDELAALAEQPGADILLVSWIEPAAVRPALGSFARLAARRHLLVQLDVLSGDELANGVAAINGAAPDRPLADWLSTRTGNHPHLTALTVRCLMDAGLVERGRFKGAEPSLDDPALAPALERIQADLAALPGSCRAVLVTLVAANDPATVTEVAISQPEGWLALRQAGLATDNAIAPLVVAAAAAQCSPAELAAGHQTVSRLLQRRAASALQRAEHMWAGRVHHDEAAEGFLEAGFELLGTQASRAAVWFDRAGATAAAGSSLALAGRGAQAEAWVLAGEFPAAMELADYVLRRNETEPHAAAAVALASAQRSRWGEVASWSARIAGHHGVGDDWWFWQQQAAWLVAGRLDHVDANLRAADQHAAVSPVVEQLRAAVLVLRAALGVNRDQLLDARRSMRSLIAAQDLNRPPTVAALVPAELLTAAALALGEPEGARQAMRMPKTAGDAATNRRRQALSRWAVLRCGDTVRPQGVAESVASGERALAAEDIGNEPSDRLELVALAVEAATARRSGDVAATGAVARQLPRLLAMLQIDLLNVDAATELSIVAQRFASPAQAEELNDVISSFLESIGGSPAFSARWHWAKLESAIAAGQAATVEEPTAALQAIAAVLPGITVLADAASTWTDVLAGNPDPVRLDNSVRDLRLAGYVWEAAQLAGQAAIRVEDANLAKSLLGQARSLRGAAAGQAGASPTTSVASAGGSSSDNATVTPAGLSEREVEVARLVINGLTHKAIGATLYISPKTVEHHVAHIRQKLGATNRAELLALLREDLAE